MFQEAYLVCPPESERCFVPSNFAMMSEGNAASAGDRYFATVLSFDFFVWSVIWKGRCCLRSTSG